MAHQAKTKFILLIILLPLLVKGQTKADLENDRKKAKMAIEKRIRQNVIDFQSGDGEAFVDIFDSSVYNKDQRAAVAEGISTMSKFYDVDFVINVEEIKVDHSMAYESGSFVTRLMRVDHL